jgi:hypothetical protein
MHQFAIENIRAGANAGSRCYFAAAVMARSAFAGRNHLVTQRAVTRLAKISCEWVRREAFSLPIMSGH